MTVAEPAPQSAVASLEEVYTLALPAIARFVKSKGGNREQAFDLLHESILIYEEQTRRDERVVHKTPEAYIAGIARHLWARQFRGPVTESLPDSWDGTDVPAPAVGTAKLLQVVARAGERCLQLLHAFYFQESKLAEVSRSLGLSGVRAASVQKYKCLEKLRSIVKENPMTYEDFLE